VQVATVSGDVSLAGALEPAARVELATHSGDVTLALPPETDASYALASFSGVISGQLADRQVSGRGPGSTMAFVQGSGAAEISIATHSGDIQLDPK